MDGNTEWNQILKRMFQKYAMEQEWDLVAVSESSCSFDMVDGLSGAVLRINLRCEVVELMRGE